MNSITHIGLVDIPKNRILKQLSLAYNNVGDEGATLIAKCLSLTVVDLNGNHVEDKGASAFRDSHVISLELAQNAVTGQGFAALCESKTLEKLSVFNNAIGFDTLTGLPCNQTLKMLYLNFNKINGSSLKPLEDLLSFPSLEKLILAKNNIDQTTAEYLYKKVTPESHPHLTRIDLTGNPIADTKVITHGYDLKRSITVVNGTPPDSVKKVRTQPQ